MVELSTEITVVTVFPDRARLTRSGTVSVAPGIQGFSVADLPLGIDLASVRASAKGTAQAQLLGIDVQTTHYIETPSEIVRELEERLQSLEEQDQARSDRSDTLGMEIQHLDNLLDSARTYAHYLSSGKTTPEAHADFLKTVAEQRDHALGEIRDLTRQRRDLAREIEKLRKEIERLSAAKPRQRYTAIIELEVFQPGELEIALTYHMTGCSWRPLYDIRLAGDRLELAYLAQVQQSTGEDWNGVELTLSTAFPALATVIPELDPWYISFSRPGPVPMPRMAVTAAAPEGLPMPQEAPAGVQPTPADAAPQIPAAVAEVGQSGASITYHIKQRVIIPGDGTPHKTTIAMIDFTPRFDYITTPRLADAAYRRAQITNESAYLLLAGPVQLFEGSDYLGATRLDLTAPGQEIELFFGADDRMRVERELIRREIDKSLIGDRRRVRFAYEIRLENHTGKEQQILIRDQIPVARHEDIKVKLDASDPKVTSQDKLNRLEWTISLASGSKHTIRFDFSVEYPRDQEVIGLPA